MEIALGDTGTFWGNAAGGIYPLQHVTFNLQTGAGEILHSYDYPFICAIGLQPGTHLLAGLALDTPDNVHLYDISDPAAPVLVHQELFGLDNPNEKGTCAVSFGENRLYVLNSNNGVVALEIQEGMIPADLSQPMIVDGTLTLTLTGSVGATYRLQFSSDLVNWSDRDRFTIQDSGSVSITDTATGRGGFYQAIAR